MKEKGRTRFAGRGGTAVRLALALTLPLLAAACGGGGGAGETPTPTVTSEDITDGAEATATVPAPTEAPSEAATPSPTEAEASHELTVPVPEGYRELESETLEIRMDPGATQELDPVDLTGDRFPSCATFLFAFSFWISEPYKPADAHIQVFSTEMEHRELLLGGTSGTSQVGCVLLEVVNDSPIEVTVEFSYKALEAEP